MSLLLPQSVTDRPFAPVRIPGSKSATNRALPLAALAPGASRLEAPLEAEDTWAMRACLEACGVAIRAGEGAWHLEGGAPVAPTRPLPVGASGTTLRFLLPWAALHLGGEVAFQGDVRLFERPLAPLMAALEPLGCTWRSHEGGGILQAPEPRSRAWELVVDPSLSSQFVSGLALALARHGGRLRWDRPVASATYLEMTAHWLEAFGCSNRLGDHGWEIEGGLAPRNLAIPGDWSGAAAFLAAAAVTGRPARIGPLDAGEPQGDRAMLEILAQAGCGVDIINDSIMMSGTLKGGLMADLTLCPDLGPVLAATAALAPAPSVLTGLHTLPLKECDRLDASAELVRWLGGAAVIEGDHTLRITPGPRPGERAAFNPRNDHRMAFAAAVGALCTGGALEQPGCVAKTFPGFWEVWAPFIAG